MVHALLSPVLDRSGKPSALKIATLILIIAPLIWLAARLATSDLGPRPLAALNHQTGLWTIRLLFIALAITPLRAILHWPKLIQIRRMVGVATALYATIHLLTYMADLTFMLDRVVNEILARTYLTIGFAALIGLLALLATSTDGMLRRLGGKRWRLLHRLVYIIGTIGIVHFAWQSKLDVTQPIIMAGLFLWLMAYRLLEAWVGERGRLPPWALVALAPSAGVLTGLGEALYFWLRNDVDPLRVLLANLMLGAGLRPAWIVFAIVGGLALIAVVRGRWGLRGPASRSAAAAR